MNENTQLALFTLQPHMAAAGAEIPTEAVPKVPQPVLAKRPHKKYFPTPERQAWWNMKRRCLNPLHPDYPQYGGRGISVCDEWQKSFAAFLEHIGPRPSKEHSLDRVNNNGSYEPGNVRWATAQEQILNKRSANQTRHTLIAYNGQSMTAGEWSRVVGISDKTIRRKYRQTLNAEYALTKYVRPERRKRKRPPRKTTPEQHHDLLVDLGRKSMAKLTRDERVARSRKGNEARWAKAKEAKGK